MKSITPIDPWYHPELAYSSNVIPRNNPKYGYPQLNSPSKISTGTVNSKNTSDDCQTIADVSISGISRVFGMRVPWWKRFTWASVLLISLGLTLAQVYDRVSYYQQTPVSVNVRVSRNQSLVFPMVTFCNKNFFNMTVLNMLKDRKSQFEGIEKEEGRAKYDVKDLVGFEGRTAKDLWVETKHSLNQMVEECWFGRGITCDEIGQWKTVFTVLGVCNQFNTFDSVRVSGLFNNLYLRLHEVETVRYKDEHGFVIHIHDPLDDAAIDVRTHGSTIKEGWGRDARLTLREFKTLPTRDRPCNTDFTYSTSKCITKCFLQNLYNNTGCVLPYMEEYEKNGKPCANPQEYENANKKAKQLLFQGSWDPSLCTCDKQCHENKYTIFTEATHTGFDGARLRVFFQDLTYDEIAEGLAYGSIALLCDIGGTVGLLLGASVLTIFEFIEVWSERMMKRCCSSRATSMRSGRQIVVS